MTVRTSPADGLPSVGARITAVLSICAGGLCGGLIGWAFADLQVDSDNVLPRAISAFIGAVVCAIGTAVIAVLVLRAMGEWRLSNVGTPSDEKTRLR